jgi:hypothetical protein
MFLLGKHLDARSSILPFSHVVEEIVARERSEELVSKRTLISLALPHTLDCLSLEPTVT